jgi:hypothetical protein
VLVSEIMLQQTQVDRVIPKYQEFLGRYPTLEALAEADVAEVKRTWYPLGYNIRPVHPTASPGRRSRGTAAASPPRTTPSAP